MQRPLQITFRDIQPSPAVAEHIRMRADKLDNLYDRISTCRVAIESPNRHVFSGKHYEVHIDLIVPGAELAVARQHGIEDTDVYVAIDRAFEEAERMVRDHVTKTRVRRFNGTPHGIVVKLFRDRGYGFLQSIDGREIYFHQHSVLNRRWPQLEVGCKVRYAEEDGDKGPQASTVELVRARHLPAGHAEREQERPSVV
jgi:cold shock CspA family protein/ribosome-associated translation inhibitor RaiA